MKKAALKPELKLGADPKRLGALGALVAILGIVWYINSSDTPRNTTPAAAPATAAAPQTTAAPRPGNGAGSDRAQLRQIARSRAGLAGARGLSTQEFRPSLKPKDAPADMSKVDPTLDLARLAKVRNSRMSGGGRSLFDFSSAPVETAAAAIPKVDPIRPELRAGLTTGPTKPQPPAPPPPPPPPPSIPLKFYGYTNSQRPGPKRAFFLEGEDIYVAGEGDVIKNRYKIIRIGVNSAVVEDTQFKNQQTLPLVEEMANS